MLLHGSTATWRIWELMLDGLEREHDVFAPTLPGHAGGPPLSAQPTTENLLDLVEETLDAAGIEVAHLVGNSLGGYVALKLAERGRARTVVALAPAGGWDDGPREFAEIADYFDRQHELAVAAAPHADTIVSTDQGRREATRSMAVAYEHIPAELLAHGIRASARTQLAELHGIGRREGFSLDAAKVDVPVRVVWGTEDVLLPWPSAATRYRRDWLPHADWVELDGVGHCAQLDVPLEATQLVLGHIH